jgi:phage/conjugal plasmid C-4 type zinc finger TraR family protein
MDEIDEAQERAELFLNNALRKHFDRPEETGRDFRFFDDDNPVICIDCEQLMDPERLEANPKAIRCVECQAKHERKLKVEGMA